MAKIDINPKLQQLIDDMIDQVSQDDVALIDRCRVADRALKLESIKKGAGGAGKGSAFDDDFDDDPDLDTPISNQPEGISNEQLTEGTD